MSEILAPTGGDPQDLKQPANPWVAQGVESFFPPMNHPLAVITGSVHVERPQEVPAFPEDLSDLLRAYAKSTEAGLYKSLAEKEGANREALLEAVLAQREAAALEAQVAARLAAEARALEEKVENIINSPKSQRSQATSKTE